MKKQSNKQIQIYGRKRTLSSVEYAVYDYIIVRLEDNYDIPNKKHISSLFKQNEFRTNSMVVREGKALADGTNGHLYVLFKNLVDYHFILYINDKGVNCKDEMRLTRRSANNIAGALEDYYAMRGWERIRDGWPVEL